MQSYKICIAVSVVIAVLTVAGIIIGVIASRGGAKPCHEPNNGTLASYDCFREALNASQLPWRGQPSLLSHCSAECLERVERAACPCAAASLTDSGCWSTVKAGAGKCGSLCLAGVTNAAFQCEAQTNPSSPIPVQPETQAAVRCVTATMLNASACSACAERIARQMTECQFVSAGDFMIPSSAACRPGLIAAIGECPGCAASLNTSDAVRVMANCSQGLEKPPVNTPLHSPQSFSGTFLSNTSLALSRFGEAACTVDGCSTPIIHINKWPCIPDYAPMVLRDTMDFPVIFWLWTLGFIVLSKKVDFEPACNAHDLCYCHCSGRLFCDKGLYDGLRSACFSDCPSKSQLFCKGVSAVYYGGVRFGGSSHYDCPTPTPTIAPTGTTGPCIPSGSGRGPPTCVCRLDDRGCWFYHCGTYEWNCIYCLRGPVVTSGPYCCSAGLEDHIVNCT